MSGGNVAQCIEKVACELKVSRLEERVHAPHVAGGFVGCAVPTGQKPLREWAPSDDDPTLSLREGYEVIEGARMSEAELDLVRENSPSESAFGTLPTVKGIVAHANVGDNSAVLQVAHSVHDRAVTYDRIGPVHLVQIDGLDSKPGRTGPRSLPYDRCNGKHRENFRRDERLVEPSVFGQCGAKDSLAATKPVSLRRVEDGDAQLESARDNQVGVARRVVRSVAPLSRSELPRAKPNARDRLGGVSAF